MLVLGSGSDLLSSSQTTISRFLQSISLYVCQRFYKLSLDLEEGRKLSRLVEDGDWQNEF